ncbi:MAG: phosphate--acyl-ACP acyltransferase, partial [Bacteroidales bacterium]|nr:phosphate--acyl-ACP acyltransferase [Bacteroidales bacterium]
MNIGLDIMGGDHAPDATIKGAIMALESIDEADRIFLFGDETIITGKLKENNIDPAGFEIVHAPDMIGMSEQPIKAFKL